MDKKILCLVLIVMMLLTCVGCSNKGNEIVTDSRFIHVEQGWADCGSSMQIIVDTETKVMYWSWGTGLTVMLDADGKPLLWEE